MAKKPSSALDVRRRTLLREKFGSLFHWRLPQIVQTVGPFDPVWFETFESLRTSEIEDCTEKLLLYSDSEIATLANEFADDPVCAEWRSFHHEAIAKLTALEPRWYDSGFGHPDHIADFVHWARMPKFSIAEMTCLSIGIEPREFSEQAIDQLNEKPPFDLMPALLFLVRRHEQLQRQFDPDTLGQLVEPRDFVLWADRVGFETHPEFLSFLRKYHAVGAVAVSASATKGKTDKREIDMIAQLFTAMVIEYFGYDPKRKRSTVTKEVTDLANSMGVSVCDGTVRKYLQHGASFIPADWEPHKR